MSTDWNCRRNHCVTGVWQKHKNRFPNIAFFLYHVMCNIVSCWSFARTSPFHFFPFIFHVFSYIAKLLYTFRSALFWGRCLFNCRSWIEKHRDFKNYSENGTVIHRLPVPHIELEKYMISSKCYGISWYLLMDLSMTYSVFAELRYAWCYFDWKYRFIQFDHFTETREEEKNVRSPKKRKNQSHTQREIRWRDNERSLRFKCFYWERKQKLSLPPSR